MSQISRRSPVGRERCDTRCDTDAWRVRLAPMASIGFIGLGIMGAPMAGRLLAAGHQVTVHNRTASRCQPLVAAGARAASTPRAAAEDADLVISIVTDSPDAKQV